MRLMLFGQIRDAAPHLHGADVQADARSLGEFLTWIRQHEVGLSAALGRSGVRYAVDLRFADAGTELSPNSEVALMSPLSGG